MLFRSSYFLRDDIDRARTRALEAIQTYKELKKEHIEFDNQRKEAQQYLEYLQSLEPRTPNSEPQTSEKQ